MNLLKFTLSYSFVEVYRPRRKIVDTSSIYVRGEENLQGWKPKGPSIIDEHQKKLDRLERIHEVSNRLLFGKYSVFVMNMQRNANVYSTQNKVYRVHLCEGKYSWIFLIFIYRWSKLVIFFWCQNIFVNLKQHLAFPLPKPQLSQHAARAYLRPSPRPWIDCCWRHRVCLSVRFR